jgi:hypothetical protein
MLTEEMQEGFYRDVICNRDAPHRYWSAYPPAGGSLVAFCGLTDIDWIAGHGEISLIAGPDAPKGTGAECVRLVLREAFERLRLVHVFGECYEHNEAVGFWEKMVERHGGGSVRVPGRKLWGGKLHGALLFWFDGASRAGMAVNEESSVNPTNVGSPHTRALRVGQPPSEPPYYMREYGPQPNSGRMDPGPLPIDS